MQSLPPPQEHPGNAAHSSTPCDTPTRGKRSLQLMGGTARHFQSRDRAGHWKPPTGGSARAGAFPSGRGPRSAPKQPSTARVVSLGRAP